MVPFDNFVLQEMMYAYQNSGKLRSGDDWIQWVFRLRRKDTRHALEFVGRLDYDAYRCCRDNSLA